MSVFQHFRFARMTDLLGRVPYGSYDHVKQNQEIRLRKLLDQALRNSRFYQRKYSSVPAGAGLDLSRYPITTKEEIRDQFDDVVTDFRLTRRAVEDFISDERNLGKWYLGEFAICHTSGSQGSPLPIVQDRHGIRVVLATMASRCRPGKRPGLLEGIQKLIRPKRIAAISFRRGFYPSGITLEFMKDNLGRLAQVERFSSVQPDLIERLNEFQPQVISGYASVMEALAVQSKELDLRSIEYFTNSSEQLSPRARKRIETAFGVPIFDHYGTGECLQLADGCQKCGDLHINADWAILEVVDDRGRPVPPGEPGSRVLVTNLANHVQPFIRYEVPDRVILRKPDQSCPNCLPRIQAIEGRAAELFWVVDGSRKRFLNGVLFHSAADSLNIIREWRAVQKTPDQIEIHVQFLPGQTLPAEEVERRLTSRLVQDGLPSSVQIRVAIRDEILPDPKTGKMRRMISEVDENFVPPLQVSSRFDSVPAG